MKVKKRRNPEVMKDGGIVSFEDIGKAMGISHAGAKFLYHNAMKKLRKNPEKLNRLHELMQMADQIRNSETTFPDHGKENEK